MKLIKMLRENEKCHKKTICSWTRFNRFIKVKIHHPSKYSKQIFSLKILTWFCDQSKGKYLHAFCFPKLHSCVVWKPCWYGQAKFYLAPPSITKMNSNGMRVCKTNSKREQLPISVYGACVGTLASVWDTKVPSIDWISWRTARAPTARCVSSFIKMLVTPPRSLPRVTPTSEWLTPRFMITLGM
jgi:hypothetical protein